MWVRDYGSQIGRAAFFILLTVLLGACKTGFGRSGDNDLESLTVSDGALTPAFSKAQTEYTVTVGASISEITINAIVEDENATLSVAGQSVISGTSVDVAIVRGPNTIEVEVTAENESRKVYEIVVTQTDQTSNNASLSDLTLKNVSLDTPFSAEQLEYGSQVNFFVNQTAVSMVRESNLAVVNINTQADGSLTDNQMSDPIALTAGDMRTIELSVRSEDRSTTNVYEVDVSRGQRDDLALASFVKASNSGFQDRFGKALAATNGTLVVGAPSERSGGLSAQGDDSTEDAGAAYVFENNGGVWSQSAFLKANSDISVGDKFGESVAVDGDWIAVGAPGRNSDSGIVYLYNRVGAGWEFNTLRVPDDIAVGDKFGETLALKQWTESGEEPSYYLLVGAPGRSSGQGAVYVYNIVDGIWLLQTTETASNGQSGDAFGSSLSLNTFSTELEYAVGAPQQGSGEGAVYVLRKDVEDDTWSQSAALKGNNTGASDNFGTSVSLRGDMLAAGAPAERSSRNGVFNFNSGDQFLDDDAAELSGAAYVFERDNQADDFEIQAYFKGDRDAFSEFGSAVAVSAGMLAVGAPKDDSGAIGLGGDANTSDREDSGAVYVFELDQVTWRPALYAKSANPTVFDEFGANFVFVDQDLFVGIPGEDSDTVGVDGGTNEAATDAGAVHIIR